MTETVQLTDTAQPETGDRAKRSDAKRNRELLINAARETFAARGAETSTDEIAKAAGVGIGTLYRHFPKRIDIVEAVYRTDVDVLELRADELLTHQDPWTALELWLQAYVAYVETKRTFLTELHAAFEKDPQLKVDMRDRVTGAAGKVLARAQESGQAIAELSAADLMQLVGGMCMAIDAAPPANKRLLSVVLAGIRT